MLSQATVHNLQPGLQYYMKVAGATQSLFKTDKYYVGPYSKEIPVIVGKFC